MTDIRESDKIYHECFNKNKDRTNKLIKKEKNVILQHILLFGNLRGMFQMELELVRKKKKQKKITTKKFIKYFQNIENIQRWLTADDSEIEILNEDDRFYIIE